MATSTPGPANGQWLRYAQLVVSNGAAAYTNAPATSSPDLGISGIDLSSLRFQFQIRADDTHFLNRAVIRIYNLAPNTLHTLLSKNSGSPAAPPLPPGATLIPTLNAPSTPSTYVYNTVTLTAGYQNGNKGTIFSGAIYQFNEGRERNVDSYLEIFAADGDAIYNGAIVAQTVPAGTTPAQQLATLARAGNIPIATNATDQLTGGIILPRGKVMFGMMKAEMGKLAANNGVRWSIQGGAMTLVPVTGYLPGEAVQINSATGMIGTPVATDGGIVVRCYINSNIKIGQLVQINQAEINQSAVTNQNLLVTVVGGPYYPADTTRDGYYRVLAIDYVGDTRGNDWYNELTCLAVDLSAPAGQQVPVAS